MGDTIDEWVYQIHEGDALDVLDEMPAESVHAVVTDPPYGLAFMGRDWDDFEPKEYQEWCENWARKAKRVLKPGGHLLAFSGNRTHHRLFTGVEDAGFEIRDTLTWHYGSGFPKAADVSKVIDKREGAEREEVGKYVQPDGTERNDDFHGNTVTSVANGDFDRNLKRTKPATDAAKRWDGWKTGLKPATEFVVMARKPFDGATVDCVLEHGTGALNVDGCRVDGGERPERIETHDTDRPNTYNDPDGGSKATGTTTEGRYPANVVFDEQAAGALDRDNEHTKSDPSPRHNSEKAHNDSTKYGNASEGGWTTTGHSDAGGPSRYFYTSKASRAERTEDGAIDNAHPTVKPQDLMEWLVKLVTREDQIVLDPFAGSGTTCKAAKAKRRKFIGIEKQAQWCNVARARCNLDGYDAAELSDESQQTL